MPESAALTHIGHNVSSFYKTAAIALEYALGGSTLNPHPKKRKDGAAMTSMADTSGSTSMTDPNITHLSLVSVPVTDQQVAKAFYTETLGLAVVRELVEGEQHWVELAPDGTIPSITLVTWFPQMPPGGLQGLVFDIDDIKRARDALRASGVEVSPIERDRWGQYARFNDPDGNGLVLRQKVAVA
jgi:catechol 2,3-dioxygenase-like lactoylglutathione lyase family enzyme